MSIAEGLEVTVRVSALLAGALAVWTFWRTAKVRRAEWLSTLHAKFFESTNYKRVRGLIDYETEPDFRRLRESVIGGTFDPLVEDLVDYLNFFEFVASLWKLGQLRTNEVSMLFQYYISILARHDFIRQYIKKEGFENLDTLLREYEKKP